MKRRGFLVTVAAIVGAPVVTTRRGLAILSEYAARRAVVREALQMGLYRLDRPAAISRVLELMNLPRGGR